MMGAGVFAVLCSGFMVIELTRHVDDIVAGQDDVISRCWMLAFALFWPKSLMLFGFGVFFIVWAIRDWHGNANRVLLLRLLQAEQEEQAP